MDNEQSIQEDQAPQYDVLKLYFGDDFTVCKGLVIHQPTIQEIIDYGETEFWTMVSLFCSNPTSMRLPLWENGVDWNDISDFELFIILTSSLTQDRTEIIFGDIDFTQFRIVSDSKDESKMVMVYMPNPTIQIDEDMYNKLVGYLRIMFDIHPKVEKAKGKSTKEAIIWEEQQDLERNLKKQKTRKWKPSTLFPLISAAVNHPGFKYKKNELREVGIVEFMDSVKRLQIYESATSLMTGMYMGMLDLSGQDLNKELNWARDLYED